MERKWYDQSQPQTLQTAVFLLYFTAALDLILGVLRGGSGLIGLLFIAGLVGGAYGIANDSKAGYRVALIFASLSALWAAYLMYYVIRYGGISASWVFNLIFNVALVVLLLHPQHKEYRRIWFR